MTSGKVPAKAFAVFAVALMLIVSIVPLLSVEKEVDAADTGEFSITYYSNNGNDFTTEKPKSRITAISTVPILSHIRFLTTESHLPSTTRNTGSEPIPKALKMEG